MTKNDFFKLARANNYDVEYSGNQKMFYLRKIEHSSVKSTQTQKEAFESILKYAVRDTNILSTLDYTLKNIN